MPNNDKAAHAEAQARYRTRLKLGKVVRVICKQEGCDRRIYHGNTHLPYCAKCWAKTKEGKEYYKKRQRESRIKKALKAKKERNTSQEN